MAALLVGDCWDTADGAHSCVTETSLVGPLTAQGRGSASRWKGPASHRMDGPFLHHQIPHCLECFGSHQPALQKGHARRRSVDYKPGGVWSICTVPYTSPTNPVAALYVKSMRLAPRSVRLAPRSLRLVPRASICVASPGPKPEGALSGKSSRAHDPRRQRYLLGRCSL
jgi:hypothetical protein